MNEPGRSPPDASEAPGASALDRSAPRPPRVAVVAVLGLAAALGYLWFEHAEVYLTDYAIPLSYLDGDHEVVLEGAPTKESRRLLADVRPGLHVLHYDAADGVRYYAELPVERGENRIRPAWQESRLPAISRSVRLGQPAVSAERSESYFVYDGARRVDHRARLAVYLAVEAEPTDPTRLLSTLSWTVELDSAVVANRTRTFRTRIEGAEPVEERIDLYADEFHAYWVDVRFVRRLAHMELSSAFTTSPP